MLRLSAPWRRLPALGAAHAPQSRSRSAGRARHDLGSRDRKGRRGPVARGRSSRSAPNARAVPAVARSSTVRARRSIPGSSTRLTTLGLTEVSAVRPGGHDRGRRHEPQARAWVALQPRQRADPGRPRERHDPVLSAPAGGLVSGQSALLRLAGSTPSPGGEAAPIACTWSTRAARPPSACLRLFEEPGAEDVRRSREGPGEVPEESARSPGRPVRRGQGQRGSAGGRVAARARDQPASRRPRTLRARRGARRDPRRRGEGNPRLGALRRRQRLQARDRRRARGLALHRRAQGEGRRGAAEGRAAAVAQVRPLRRSLRERGGAPARGRALRDRERRLRERAQPALRGGDGGGLRALRGAGAPRRGQALARRDLRRGRQGRLDRAGARGQPGARDRRHPRYPHAGDGRLHRGRGAVARDAPARLYERYKARP